jgi:hypothetical protein
MKVMKWLRLLGLLALGVASVVVLNQTPPAWPATTANPPAFTPSSASSDVDSALSDERLNSDSATSAPQQAVVEGWAARDLLAIVGRELGGLRDDVQSTATASNEQIASIRSSEPDSRMPRLLTLVVLAIAFWGATAAAEGLIAGRGQESEPVEPDSDAGSTVVGGGPLPDRAASDAPFEA